MENLKTIGAVVAFAADAWVFYGIWKGLIKEQNFSTWMLWGLLACIVTITIIINGGHNYKLSAIYAFCSLSIGMLLLIKKEFAWTRVDWWTAAGVLICLGVWAFLGTTATTVASTTAVVISGYPLLETTYKKPHLAPKQIYFMFCIASAASLIAAKDWSIKEALYPEATLGISIIFVLLSLRKPKGKKLSPPCTYDILVG